MIQSRKRLLYFLLLGIPTLVIGGAALFMLRHEQRRLESRLVTDTRIKGKAIAQAIANAIEDTQSEVMTYLRFQMTDQSLLQLIAYRNHQPSIRNGFVWHRATGLRMAPEGSDFTSEEQRFAQRYQTLFSLGTDWSNKAAPENLTFGVNKDDIAGISAGRTGSNFGWKVWFWEDRFSWLGWVAPLNSNGTILGVELESMYVLSRVLARMQLSREENTIYQLIDHRGMVFHQTGPVPGDSEGRVQVPVGEVLPGWSIAALVPLTGAGSAGRFFTWPAKVILVMLIVAVLLAGWALLKQADRNYRDALQKTNFVANVSHELKTPLTSISMYAEMLQNARVQDEVKRAEYLSVIVNQAQRLTRLVNNVLTFGRLEQGKGSYECKPIALADSVREVLISQEPRLRDQGISLATNYMAVGVRADGDAVAQVLLNLLDNAVKYGCGESCDPSIEVRVSDGMTHGEIWVMDHGPGVAVKWRTAIFEKFFRGDDSLTRKMGGSGIGLSIARLLITDMGGSLNYVAKPGYGACFVIRLPKQGEVV